MKHLYLVLHMLYEMGDWFSQFVYRVVFSVVFSVCMVPAMYLAELFNIYFFFDIQFIEIVVIFITAALVMGAWKHWRLKTFSHTRLILGLIEQTLIVTISMVTLNAFTLLNELKHSEDAVKYFNLVWKLAILVYLGISIAKSMTIITNGKFPPIGFIRRMKSFNSTLDIGELTKNK